MSKGDRKIRFGVITLIVIHLAIFSIGFTKNKLPVYLAFLNGVSGLCVIIYWIQKQLRINQHIFEFREIAFLFIEFLFIVFTVYYITTNYLNDWIKILQYIIFGLHLIILLMFFVFILTFKMKRLF